LLVVVGATVIVVEVVVVEVVEYTVGAVEPVTGLAAAIAGNGPIRRS
jgi:hypothetical protein